ncbi:hypothetical protein Gpo141_00014337 [Globisporangium polare]
MSVESYPPFSSLQRRPGASSPYSGSSRMGDHRPSWADCLSAPPSYSRHTAASASYASLTGAPASSSTERSPHLTGELRRGKWTLAEEEYTAATIQYFCSGTLGIPYGTTLRSYLAQQLHCDPMRISKKLLPGSIVAGYKMMPKIGRRGYYPRLSNDSEETAAAVQERVDAHLRTLHEAFIASLDALREEEDEYELLEARYRDYYHQQAVSTMVAMPLTDGGGDDGEERSPLGSRKRRLREADRVMQHEAASTPKYPVASRPRTHSAPSYSGGYRHHDDYANYQRSATSDRRLRVTPPLTAQREPFAAESSRVAVLSPSPTSVALPSLRVSLQRASLIMAAKLSR